MSSFWFISHERAYVTGKESLPKPMQSNMRSSDIAMSVNHSMTRCVLNIILRAELFVPTDYGSVWSLRFAKTKVYQYNSISVPGKPMLQFYPLEKKRVHYFFQYFRKAAVLRILQFT
jgi:hypothetical protein